MKYKNVSFLAAVLLFASPFIASAQTESTGLVGNLFSFALGIINDYLVPLIFAVAFVIFLFRVYQLFIQGGTSPDSAKKGRQFVLVSLVGFFLMFSVWGLINLLINTLGFDSASMPAIPTFGTQNSSGSSNSLFNSGSNYSTGTIPGTTTSYSGTPYAAVNGTCNAGTSDVLSGTTCYPQGSSSSGAGLGNGTVQSGATCSTSDDCSGNLICNSSHMCAADSTLDAGDGSVGSACRQSNDDCSGNLICGSNGTCQADSQLDAGDGTQGSACSNQDQCGGNLICSSNGTCQIDSSVDVGNGSEGSACNSDNQCGGSLVCDQNSGTCQDNNAAGVQETGDGSTDSSDNSDSSSDN
jgi:hypothetical protein